jgi:hypothetical protein
LSRPTDTATTSSATTLQNVTHQRFCGCSPGVDVWLTHTSGHPLVHCPGGEGPKAPWFIQIRHRCSRRTEEGCGFYRGWARSACGDRARSVQFSEGIDLDCRGGMASYFLRDENAIFHTYSVYARGTESLGGSYYFLDLTALGRQEEWEEPKDRVPDARASLPDFTT